MYDEVAKFHSITEAINYIRVARVNELLPWAYFEFGCNSGRTFSDAFYALQVYSTFGQAYFIKINK